MAAGLGQLSVDLLLETQQWTEGLVKAQTEVTKGVSAMQKTLDSLASTVENTVKGFLTFEAVKEVFLFIAHATHEAEDAAARLGIAMKNVGEVAGLSSERINELADALGRTTQFDDESYRNAAASIVRFGGVTQEVLERTLKASADFAAFTGTNLVSATETLSRALASPAQGIERLQRTIGYIDEDTKKYIKTLVELGDTAGAQAEILKLVEKATAGAAETMGNTASGQTAKFTNAVSNLAEAVGGLIFHHGPTESFLKMFTDKINQTTDAIDKMDITKLLRLWLGLKDLTPGAQMPKEGGAAKQSAEQQAKDAKQFADSIEAQNDRAEKIALANMKKREEENKKALEKRLKDEKDFVGSFHLLHVKEVDDHVELVAWGAEQMASVEHKRLKEEADAYKEYVDALRDKYGELFKNIETFGRDAFFNFFSDVDGGWKGMLKGMAKDFKKLLMDLVYQQIAKPLILNLIANVPGGLGQYATTLGGQAGGGFDFSSLASGGQSAYDWFTGGSSMSENAQLMRDFGGVSTEGGAAAGAGTLAVAGIAGGVFGHLAANMYGAGDRGVANATNYGAAGATAGAYIGSIVPVVGTIAGAVIGGIIGTIVGISTDPDPDAMRKANFGKTAGAEGVTPWTGKSAFGDFGFSKGEWLSDEQMGSTMKAFIGGITLMDNALASFMSPEQVKRVKANLDSATKQYELGMEHGDVSGLGAIIKDRLIIVAHEFSEGLEEFVKNFEGSTEDLVAIVTSFAQAKGMAADFDPEAIVQSLQPKKMMDAYQEQRGGLDDFIKGMDTSAASMTSLVAQMGAFQVATVQMILAIDAAAASMHAMFMTTAENITMSTMSPEEQYNYLQAQTEELYKQLQTETDPAEIERIAKKIDANINKAWGLLSPDQQQLMKQSFLDRLNVLDEAVATKMGALRGVVIEDSKTIMTGITEKLDALFVKADAAAVTQQAAADANLTAANTPVTVVVVVSDGGSVTQAG